jgi:hypothetical protein
MANNGWTPLGKKVDLGREVQGTLPITSMDPLVQDDVTDGYNLGTGTDGLPILEGKDTSNQLAFYRVKPGVGVTIVQQGNSLVINSSVLTGDTPGIMLQSEYDTLANGIVDEARLADSCSWSNVTGKPTSYPPSPHTHAESDIINLGTDLASKVPQTRLVTTSYSLQGGGPLSADLNLSLIGDMADVGPDMRYGTDPSGNLGWYPASVGAGDMTQDVYDKNHNGIVDLSEGLTNLALTTAMISDGAVTGVKIASQTIPGGAFASTAVTDSLGYIPLNKAGDTASGQLVVQKIGPPANSNMYQGAHLLAETSGSGSGVPCIAFACLVGGASAGSVAMWYQGPHADINLQYGDGTTAHLLSSISSISGAQIIAGSITAGNLAAGTAVANLGYTPVNGDGGQYDSSQPFAIQHDAGLGATSWSVAGLRVQTVTGGGNRPQIGFYYPGTACSLYFEPGDITMRYIDSGGTVRVLLDSTHPAYVMNAIGYTPVNKAGDVMTGNLQAPFLSVSDGGWTWTLVVQGANLYAIRENDNYVKQLAP